VKLALLNEILGRTHSGPIVFGCQVAGHRRWQAVVSVVAAPL
jgi:hypothetical protein